MSLRIYWKVTVWIVVMLVVFLMPSRNLPEGPEIPMLDKIIHFFMFFVFALFFCEAIIVHKKMYDFRFSLLVKVLITGFVFGGLIELAQLLPYLGREADLFDLFSDWIGTIFGLLLARMLKNRFLPSVKGSL